MKTLRHIQTKEKLPLEALFRLPVSAGVISPYFTGRDTKLITKYMAVTKAIAVAVTPYNSDLGVDAQFYDGNTFVLEYNLEIPDTSLYTTPASIKAAAEAVIIAFAATQGFTAIVSAAQIEWANQAIGPVAAIAESALSLSVQTSTGAVGTQIDAARDSFVMVNAGISTTATIGGAATGDLVIEVAPTNSATAGDWVEKARVANSQTVTLAIVLNSVQVVKGMLVAFVPAGYYVKVRSITGSGSPTYSISSARKVLM